MVNLKAKIRVKTKNGLYPVYIRFTKQNQVSYVKTSWVVTEKGLNNKKEIIDPFVIQQTSILIENYYNQKDNFIDVEKEIPQFMQEAVSNLWIGQVEDRYYSVVMPMHFEDSDYCKQLASEDENVFFVNKVQDVSGELNVLTKQMIVFLAIAFAVMIVIMFFFYNWKKVLKIIAIPMVTVLACVAVFAACNIPLGFFSITGIILVFGLSIDYIIYSVESSEVENTVAIVLSFISSAISFGALALSTFAPVFMFGLAVFAGLTTAVVCTILLKSLR